MKKFIIFSLCISSFISHSQTWYNIYDEQFNDNHNVWAIKNTDDVQKEILNGTYIFDHKKESGGYNETKYLNFNASENFKIEVRFKKISGIQNNGYGLIFGRKDSKNQNKILISGDGSFLAYKSTNGIKTGLSSWTKSTAINKGNGSFNIISIKKEGNKIYYLINYQLVHTEDFTSLIGFRMGFLVYNAQKIAIDYLKVFTGSLEESYNKLSEIDKKKFNLEGALNNINKAISMNNSNSKYYTNRASIHSIMGSYSLAILDYTKAIELNPSAFTYGSRGNSYAIAKMYDKAEKDYTKAIELMPSNSYVVNSRAKFYVTIGRNKDAEIDFTKSIELSTHSYYYIERAKFYAKTGENNKAELDFNKAIEMDDIQGNYQQRGLFYLRIGDTNSASADFQRSVELAKGDLNGLAWAKCYSGDYKGAISDVSTELIKNKVGYIYDTRATAYALDRQYHKSLNDFDKANNLDPDNPIYYFKRGIIKKEMGDNIGGENDIKIAKKLNLQKDFFQSNDPLIYAFSDKYKPLEDQILSYVKTEVNSWQKKGKYESSSEYKNRVTIEKRDALIAKLTKQATNEIALKSVDLTSFTTNYDADNELFEIRATNLIPFYIKVPRTEAEVFDENVNKLIFSNKDFTLSSQNQFILAGAKIKNPANNKYYLLDLSQSSSFTIANIAVNFKPIEVEVSKTESSAKAKKIKSVSVGLPDIDVNVPVSGTTSLNSFALIIGNESYTKEISVPYAANDAASFKNYASKVLGVPNKQIHMIQNATYGQMLGELDWIYDVIAAYKGSAIVYFYYAGHGIPDEATKSAYLVPVDGYSGNLNTSIKLEDIYEGLTKTPSKSVNVFLDACFSGGSRSGSLASGRGVKIKPKAEIINGNMIVLSASSGEETAHPYEEKSHGLFTYFLLKKLQQTKGNATWGELSTYVTENVSRVSVVNSKSQTPSIIVSPTLSSTWQLKTIK